MMIFVKGPFTNSYIGYESLAEALKRYTEDHEELGEAVDEDDMIYLASGVDEGSGKRYYAIHDNADYGVLCTPAELASFESWWDASWDSEVY